MGSIGLYEAVDITEMKVLYNKLNREISKTYLKYESQRDVNNKVLIQQKVVGTEFGLDIINNLNKEYKTTICKIKYAMRAGETDCAMTICNENLKKLGETLGKSIKHIGNMDVDIIVENEVPYNSTMHISLWLLTLFFPIKHSVGSSSFRNHDIIAFGRLTPDICENGYPPPNLALSSKIYAW